MGNMHLVTGYAGKEHVSAADHGAFHATLFGSGQFVFGRGNQLSASIVTNNLIRVLDGDIYMQGRHIRVNEDTYVDLAIENGSQGYMRNDLIVARYTKDASTGVEDVNLVVIKGNPVASNPVDPAYTSGDIINDHAILNDMPLYRVPLNGLDVGDLVPLFSTFGKTLLALNDEKQDKTNNLTAVSSLADGDYFPFYDVSVQGHRKTLWSTIKNFFAAAVHKHAASDITSGTLAVTRGGTGCTSLEALVSALPLRVVGGYVAGTLSGTASGSQTVSLGFTPDLVLVLAEQKNAYSMPDASCTFIAAIGVPGYFYTATVLEIVDGGFKMTAHYRSVNGSATYLGGLGLSGSTYKYIAVKGA